MELGNDLIHALRRQIRGAGAAEPAGALDWPGLRARLAATHAARALLQDQDAGIGLARGSFAPAAAISLATADHADLAINLFDSTDRKACSGNDRSFAGVAQPAVREC